MLYTLRAWGEAREPVSDSDGQPEKPKQEAAISISTIYSATLAPNEFRLACLTAPTDKDSPIHLTLETYTDDNCPEYKPVSYTWEGEDGNNSLSSPIFIEPYWDVLLQTRNCWEILRFMRPTRGIRCAGHIKDRVKHRAELHKTGENLLGLVAR